MSDSIASSDGPCYFLALPPEIRVMIYKLCLNPVACDLDINNQAELIKIRQIIVNELRTLRKQATLVQLSRLIRQEPLSIYVDLIKTGLQLWTAKYEEAVSGYSTPDGGPSPKQLAFEPHGALMWCLIRRRLRQTTNQLQDRLERWQRIEKIWRCKETNQPDSSHQARLTNHLDECEELNAPEHNGSRLEQIIHEPRHPPDYFLSLSVCNLTTHIIAILNIRIAQNRVAVLQIMATTPGKCFLLEIPPELRLVIYKFYLLPSPLGCESYTPKYNEDPSIYGDFYDLKTKTTILRTCRLSRKEAMLLFQDAMEAGVQYWLKATGESQQQILHSYRQDAGFGMCTGWDAVVVKRNLELWLVGSQKIEQFCASIEL